MGWAGYPDWSAPASFGGRLLFPAYEQPGRFLAPPVALDAVAPDGRSPLQLDVYRQDRGLGGLANFSLLTIRFAARYDLHGVRADIGSRHPELRVEPLVAESGLLRLTAAAALGLPAIVLTPQPLDITGVGSVLLSVRLDGPGSDLFVGALARGLATIGAQAWVVVRGVAARAPGEVRLDPAAFAAAANVAFGSTDAISVDALRKKLAEAPESLAVRLSARMPTEQRSAFAEALLDRILGKFAVPVPSPQDAAGAWIRLDAAAMRPGEVDWALDEPILAPRLFALEADPLGPLRTLPAGEIEGQVVSRHDVAALASGRRTLSIMDTLPRRRIGLLRAAVEIEVPPAPPSRPATIRATAPLDATKNSATTELRLAAMETLAFDWHTVAFVISGGAVETIEGTPRHHDREHLVVTPDDFGLRFVTVEAEPSLLAEARVTVECAGMRKGQPWALRGVLEAAEPALAFAVPEDVAEAQIVATATSLASGVERRMEPIAAGALRLDPFSFEGSGARNLDLSCTFDDAAPEALLELAPEDRSEQAAARTMLRLMPAAPQARWTWLALSPFRSGYRWRWAGATAWSAALDPATPLAVRSSGRLRARPQGEAAMSEQIEIDGVRLVPIEGEPSGWSYQSTKAGIAQDAEGRKQFTLIKAGPIAMLALTAMWGVAAETLERVRESLAAKTGVPAERVVLSHALVEVGEVQLLIGDGAGGFTSLASAHSSGAPPYNAAFNLTLDAGQAGKIGKAVQGARGWLAVRYVVAETAPASHSSTVSAAASASSSGSIRQATGSSSASAAFAEEASMSAEAASSTGPPETRTFEFQSDAADWGLAG